MALVGNGNGVLSMNELMNADPVAMGNSVHAMKFLVSALYVVIAASMFWAGRKAKDKKQRFAVYLLVSIFVMCDLSGYLLPALVAPNWLIFSGHFILVPFCFLFILSNQHEKIFARS